MVKNYMDTRSNSRANTCVNTFWWYLLDPNQPLLGFMVNHDNCSNAQALPGHSSFKFLPYQLLTVV